MNGQKITQPEALRLYDQLTKTTSCQFSRWDVAAELKRLHEVNAELVEALEDIYEAMYVNEYGDFSLQSHYDAEPLRNALAKATGEQP